MINKIRGFIVSEVAYGDTSKIINIITEEYGLIGCMCKGAKAMKSKLRATTSKFTYGDFHMYYKPGKLSTLIDVDVINDFSNLKQDIRSLGYLTYLTDLTTQVFKQSELKEIYSLFISGVTKMNEGLDVNVIANILEIKYLDFLGVGLNLNSCNKCGNTTNILTINPDIGGYICSKCRINEPLVDPKTIKMLRMYYYVELSSITKVDISAKISQEISDFLDKYYERYTGMYIKSKIFLNKIK